MRNHGRPEKRAEETHQADRRRFFPFGPEGVGIKFGAGEKRQHDRTCTCKECDPGSLRTQRFAAGQCSDRQLSDGSNNDFKKCRLGAPPDWNFQPPARRRA